MTTSKNSAAAPAVLSQREVPASVEARGRWYLAAAPIWTALAHLCIPMAAGLAVGAIYNIINAGFIGSLHDTALLAAITFSIPLLGIVMAIGGVFGVGAAALISRLLGESETDATAGERIKFASSFAVWGTVFSGAVIGILGLTFLEPVSALLGADAAALPATTTYVGMMFVFTPVLALTFCLEQLVRAQGAAKQSMIGLIASTVANLLFDVLFILVLNWGIFGAGLALGLANLVSVAYYVRFLQRHGTGTSLAPRWFRLDGAIIRPIFGVGAGELVQSSFLIVTTLLLNHLAVAYGDNPLAAFGVALRIVQLPEFLVMGIALGMMPLLAYSFGRGDRTRMQQALKASVIAIAGVVLVFSGAVFLLRDQVFGLFTADPALMQLGVLVLTAQLVATVVNGFTALITTVFQATARIPAALTMSILQGVLFIPIVLLGHLWFGLDGIIWAMTVTELIVFAVGGVLYLANRNGIERGMAEGSPERAEAMLAEAESH